MLAANSQSHAPKGYLTDPTVASADDGLAYFPTGPDAWATGENIFAYSANVNPAAGLKAYVDYLDEGLTIDWGVPDLGHLKNLLAPARARRRPAATSPTARSASAC